MAMVDRYTTYVELFVDAVTMDTADKLDPTDGVAKGVTIAFVGLGVVLVIGTLMFGWLESMKWVDAAYFTVVTARMCDHQQTFALCSLFHSQQMSPPLLLQVRLQY